MPVFWFIPKLMVLLYGTVWVRASLPRLRYDQLMDLGWKYLIELAFLWAMVTGVVVVARDQGWNRWVVVPAAIGGALVILGLLGLHAGSRRVDQRGGLNAFAHDHPAGGQLMGLAKGFGVTIREMFRPRVTTEYPNDKRPKPDRFHGRHVLNRYEDGMEKCIGCELCAGVCPARCIYVRGADNPPDAPVSPGERYGFVYEINYLRCIHCDLCVEACPTEAITETKLFEFSFTNRQDAIYTKDELLVDDDGRARRQPWELWLGGEDDDTSAWMRATAPGGHVEFEGRVAWVGRVRVRRAIRRTRPVRQRRRPEQPRRRTEAGGDDG